MLQNETSSALLTHESKTGTESDFDKKSYKRPDRPDYTNILDKKLKNGSTCDKIKRILKVVRLELNSITSYKVAIVTIALAKTAGQI